MRLEWSEGHPNAYYQAKLAEAERQAKEPCLHAKTVFCEVCQPVRASVIGQLRKLLKQSME